MKFSFVKLNNQNQKMFYENLIIICSRKNRLKIEWFFRIGSIKSEKRPIKEQK